MPVFSEDQQGWAADLANDSGISTWLAVNAGTKTNSQVG